MTLRWTEEDLKAHQERFSERLARLAPKQHRSDPRDANLIPGRKPKGGMNKWEAQFAEMLEDQRKAGELVWWAFEPFRIRLAEKAFYRPDFVAVDAQGKTHIYEVKGFFREAAKVRLKVAAEKLPYAFYIVRKDKGDLRVTRI
jgi:hypothetical protein